MGRIQVVSYRRPHQLPGVRHALFLSLPKVVRLGLILPLAEIRNEIQQKEAKHVGVRFGRGIKILGLAENLPFSPNSV